MTRGRYDTEKGGYGQIGMKRKDEHSDPATIGRSCTPVQQGVEEDNHLQI